MYKKFHKLLIKLSNSHHKISRSQFADLGLSPGQPKILEALSELGTCMQKDLARACDVEPPTITSILPAMEERGLVKREALAYESGKRALGVSLTDKGRALELEVERVMDEVEKLCFKGFSKEEIDLFLSMLERIYENLG